MHTSLLRFAILRSVVSLTIASLSWLALPAEANERSVVESLVVRVIDSDGKPIHGVEVGINASFGVTGSPDLLEGSEGWHFACRAISDGEGIAKLANADTAVGTVIVAKHSGQKLIGYSPATPKDGTNVVTMQLTPAYQLIGEMTCTDLTKKGQAMPQCSVQLIQDGRLLARYISRDGKMSFPVPEGKFRLRVRGNPTRVVYRDVEIDHIRHPHAIKIDLPAKRLTLLQGTVAPAFQDITSWKNGPATQPADCRGNYILIDFWGHWCPPCIRSMPHLIDLHEEFSEKGLTVIGAHVDNGEGIDSVQKLDDKLAVAREQLWGGRDIPFPIALLRAQHISRDTRNDEDALSATAADYGITSYPTCILVEPAGRIVQRFRPNNAADRQRLKELLTQWHEK